MSTLQMTAPCIFGLESVLAGELRRMGAENVRAENGRVFFEGGQDILIRANLHTRTAERILLVLGRFRATSFEELFDAAYALPWEDYIGRQDAFPVKGWSLESALHSIPDCQRIIKKAVAKRLGNAYRIGWLEETGAVHQIRFAIHKNEVLLTLDTSGAGLHKRGYRQNSMEAPIKETLAAGILDLAHVKAEDTLCDPMCGSGTFLIEGVYRALQIAPGLRRRFSVEHWGWVPRAVVQSERERALSMIRRDAPFRAYGFDLDPEAVALTEANLKKAGVSGRVRVQKADISRFSPEQMTAVVCNPPYGERLLDLEQAQMLCRRMGEVFTAGESRYYIISPLERFEELFGRKADKRRKLYNGTLLCYLFMYFSEKRR